MTPAKASHSQRLPQPVHLFWLQKQKLTSCTERISAPVCKQSSLFHHKCCQVFVWRAEIRPWSDLLTTNKDIGELWLIAENILAVLNDFKWLWCSYSPEHLISASGWASKPSLEWNPGFHPSFLCIPDCPASFSIWISFSTHFQHKYPHTTSFRPQNTLFQ